MSLKKTIDNIYYNVRINGNADGSLAMANYAEQRTISLLDNPSNYYFSCIRFNIPTSTIPLLIVASQPFPNTNPALTVYSVSLSYNGVSSGQTFVYWNPTVASNDSLSLATPKRTLNAQTPFIDPKDEYYYCYSYSYFMSLVNKAFIEAFNNLSALTTLPLGSVPPYYTFDSRVKLFTLVAQGAFYDMNNLTPIQIFMNNALFNLFGAVSAIRYTNPTISGNDKQIIITSDNSNTDASGNIQFEQEYISLTQWMAMKSVIITTNTIPIVAEGIPSVSNNYTPDNEQNGSSTYLPIISAYDALIATAGFEDFQSTIQYAPSGPYKLIDMIGTNALSSFDIQVYWMDVYGTLHNLFISPFESCTFTFLFLRKGVPQIMK